MHSLRKTPPIKQRQHGAVFIVMLVIMVIGVITFLVTSLNSSSLQIKRDSISSQALAQAKDALIGRAVGDTTSPGSLPCPDINNDGVSEGSSTCASYIGRLPWKTLGLPDLRDGSGERLWYALSPNFRDYVTTNPINSNSKGVLQVFDNTGVTQLTSEAVAIIFAPGAVTGSQQRDAANLNSAPSYLDVGPNGVNNHTSGGPFIAANGTSLFNDQLLIIKASDIMPVVEARVAKELSSSFAAYLSAHGNTYPYPANFNTCTSSNCPSDNSVCIGKIPATDPAMASVLPTWFTANHWFDVIYYTAGTSSLAGSGGTNILGWGKLSKGYGSLASVSSVAGTATGSGTGCYASTLHVSLTSLNALFIMPGTPLAGITRTSLSSANMAQYFEDVENQNLDDLYVIPSANSNDSLYTLP